MSVERALVYGGTRVMTTAAMTSERGVILWNEPMSVNQGPTRALTSFLEMNLSPCAYSCAQCPTPGAAMAGRVQGRPFRTIFLFGRRQAVPAVQMLSEGPSSGLTQGACEVLQQMARLSPTVATGILCEGGLWSLVQLLVSFQQLLDHALESALRSSAASRTMRRISSSTHHRSSSGGIDGPSRDSTDGVRGERRVARCASVTVAAAYAALEREREAHPVLPPLPSGAMPVAQAVAKTCHVLLEQRPAAQEPFLAMGGVHVLIQLLRDLKVWPAESQTPDCESSGPVKGSAMAPCARERRPRMPTMHVIVSDSAFTCLIEQCGDAFLTRKRPHFCAGLLPNLQLGWMCRRGGASRAESLSLSGGARQLAHHR